MPTKILIETNFFEQDLRKIYLIHISVRHGDGEKFKKIIQSVVGDNLKVIVAKNKILKTKTTF